MRFPFNVWTHRLEASARILRRGLEAAERALAEETGRMLVERDELDRRIEAGDETGYEFGEDGDLVYDPHEGIHYELMAIEETVQQVRRGMMVALYHAWERTARDATRLHAPRDDHRKLTAALRELDVEPTAEIDHLRMLANLVKHGSKRKAVLLWNVRPDLFYEGFHPEVHFPNDWEDTVRIKPSDVDAFVEAATVLGTDTRIGTPRAAPSRRVRT